jgi:hypothetical protein
MANWKGSKQTVKGFSAQYGFSHFGPLTTWFRYGYLYCTVKVNIFACSNNFEPNNGVLRNSTWVPVVYAFSAKASRSQPKNGRVQIGGDPKPMEVAYLEYLSTDLPATGGNQ